MVNITKTNFIQQSNDLLLHLPTSRFIAIDEEMTGIQIPSTTTNSSTRLPKHMPPDQQYKQLKQVPERYAIIQLGISLFHNNPESNGNDDSDHNHHKGWKVRRYNFFVWSETRETVMNPGAVAFLNQHNMSWDQWMIHGVPYVTTEIATERIQKYVEKRRNELQLEQDKVGGVSVQETLRRQIELRRSDDIEFFARAMAELREWLDTAPSSSSTAAGPIGAAQDDTSQVAADTFLLPACNAFLRRALYEAVGREYPSLILENAGKEHPGQIRVLRLTEEEKKGRDLRLQREEWNNFITQSLGMWRVFDAIRRVCSGKGFHPNSPLFAPVYDHVNWDIDPLGEEAVANPRVPLVVHNGMMDLLFLLTHFHSNQLPNTLVECKDVLQGYFPVIYDTKAMSTECGTIWNNEMTNLASLFQRVVVEDERLFNSIDVVPSVGDGNEQHQQDQEHEAAYDAYMTGAIFIGLCYHIQRKIREREGNHYPLSGTPLDDDEYYGRVDHKRFARNRLFQMSMFTLDLDTRTRDPLSRGMSPECSYLVSDIDKSVSTRDIVISLGNDRNGTERQVEFDIVWIDDITFIVSAKGEGSLMEKAKILFDRLRTRFPRETIVRLDEYYTSLSPMENNDQVSLLSRWFNWFAGRKRGPDDNIQRVAKRIRSN